MKKKITLEDVFKEIKNLHIRMIKGFKKAEESVDQKIENLAIMVQKQFAEARGETNGLRTEMHTQFDKLEKVTLLDHTQQIEKLRDGYLVLKTKVDRDR